jgi:triacylglycerol lipase
VIARLQRTTVFLLLFTAALWFVSRAWQGQWLAASIGALLLLNLQPLVLAFEFFVLLPWLNRRDPTPRPSWGQLVRAWWRESLTAHAVFSWHQPFRAACHADSLGPTARGRRAVVLVHGFFCNRAVWNRWMAALHQHGVPFVAVTLEPPFAGIDHYATVIDQAVERAAAASGLPPVIVGHSMGGLAIRAWWRAQGAQAASRVASVITIGSPHHGTFSARFAKADNARQMAQASDWLTTLAASESAEQRARFTCFYSHCDNIVMPASTAALPGADNRHLPGEPHVALAFAPQVFDEVLRRVRAPELTPRSG